MKLIKQNDSAGGLIFKQNQNGKAMKQNYNFGKKSIIQNRSIWLDIPNLISEDATGWTFCLWTRDGVLSIADRRPIFYTRNAENTVRLDVWDNVSSRTQDLGFINVFYAPAIDQQTNFLCVTHDGVNNFIISEINIAKGGVRAGSPGLSDIDDLRIFDRTIDNSEASYAYNNRLGNDPLSVLGLKCWINFNTPEIFGSEIIHSDLSGNGNYARYNGLPAGTMEEKLQYVIDNLLISAQ